VKIRQRRETKQRGHRMYDESGNLIPEDPWSSIVDLMSALVLVLFLAVIFFVSNYSEVTTALDNERVALQLKTDELKSAQAEMVSLNLNLTELKRREEALSVKASELSSEKRALLGDKARLIAERDVLSADRDSLTMARAQLLADKEKLVAERDSLSAERDQLSADKKSIAAERAQLLTQKERLEREQDALLGDKRRLLDDQEQLKSKNDQLDAQVASLTSELKALKERQQSVMTSLSDAFKQANAQGVSVDKEGGKITMKSEVLFGVGEALLSEQGMRELDGISKGLSRVLNNPKYKDLIEGVMIEGHTSSEGKGAENRALSADRALAALNYLLKTPQSPSERARYERLFFAGAFGEGRPIINQQGQEQPALSRRIEIRILFNQTDTQRLTHDLTQLK
jgi:chemotaxis protein MotB